MEPYQLPAPGTMNRLLDAMYAAGTDAIKAELEKVLADPLMVADANALRVPMARPTDPDRDRWHTTLRQALRSLMHRRAEVKDKKYRAE